MILDKKKLEKYMEHHQEVADRNYRTYQETGIARYDYAYANRLIAGMKFEQLEMYTMNLIMGIQ